MGRSEVYGRADVNDIIHIVNQAARFQCSGSSALAAGLEKPTCTPDVEQTAQTGNDRSDLCWLFVISCLCGVSLLF